MFIFCKANRFLLKRYVFNHQLIRLCHSKPTKVLYPLESRKLLRVRGKDSPTFLQGLITNDMRHFEEGSKSIFAMFLNNKGRVLYDVLIHKWDGEDSFLLECDKDVHSMLHRHLKIYKLKRAVEFEDVSQSFKVWALVLPLNETVDTEINPNNSVNIYKDSRLPDLGFRVLSSTELKATQVADKIGKNILIENKEDGYRCLRYKLGVSEGASDLPSGSSFPLEVNCDYLHGVSFHKGCYIGQELTARVHHTGVVRKRIMPFKFNEMPKENIEKDSIISVKDNPKSNYGKLKGYVNEYGIGLLRIKEALDLKTLSVGNVSLEVTKPSWWPLEAPKEKIISKTE